MLDRSRTRPKDLNQLAHSLTQEAVGEAVPEPAEPQESGKDPAAVSLGRRGGQKGGKARAAKMTPEERSEAARQAARKRWDR